MIGHLSKEGFELFHLLLNSLFNDVKSIISTRQRVNCAATDVQRIIVQVKDATSGQKEGLNQNNAAKCMG